MNTTDAAFAGEVNVAERCVQSTVPRGRMPTTSVRITAFAAVRHSRTMLPPTAMPCVFTQPEAV